MALNGSVTSSAYIGGAVDGMVVLNWTATQNVTNNTSVVAWELVGKLVNKDGTPHTSSFYVVSELEVTFDGIQVYYRDKSKHTDCYNGTVLASGTQTISHNNDGSKTLSIGIGAGIYVWEINCRGAKEFALTTIPRASGIGATDANIGSKSAIVVTKKASSYTHSIKYEFGNLTGYVTEEGGVSSTEVKYSATSISWTIPTTFYAQIPNAKTGTCTLTIKTYSGSTQIGDAQTDTFTVTAARSLCAPSVSGSVVDSNATTKALTGDESKLVRYKSTAKCTILAEAKNSATISQKKIAGAVVSEATRSIAAVEVSSFAFYAKDSRGYEGSTTVEAVLIPYVLLTCNPEVNRTDSTSGNAVLSIKGNYFNGSFGAVTNSLQLKYRIMPDGGEYGNYVTVNPIISGNTYSAEVALTGLDYKQAFTIEVVAADAIDTLTKTEPLDQGIPNFDMGADSFRINVFLRLAEANHGTELPEFGVKDQIFLLHTSGGWVIKIHDGTSWT